MKLRHNLIILPLALALILLLLLSACGLKTNKAEGQSNDLVNDNSKNTVTFSSPNIETFAAPLSDEDKLVHEMKGLSLILSPYMDSNSNLFIGEENMNFLQSTLLNAEDIEKPLPASDWEKAVRIIFSFEKRDTLFVNMYISDLADNGMIKRQYTISGLMKLLTLRYPSLSLESNYENVKKSEIIPDFNDITDTHQLLIRQAYCLGFTDITVDSERLFRPQSPLNAGEAISILYRTLTNLGLPQNETIYADDVEKSHTALLSLATESSVDSFDVFSLEDITKEYDTYLNNLKKLNNKTARKKLELLTKAENIIAISTESAMFDENLALEQWRKILHEVFAFELEQIDPYLKYETNGTLPYDIAAISIFELSEIYGDTEAKVDVLEEKAREMIPQFDTARDKKLFARMFSSGLLDGLYLIPGFTPQRPVNKAEGLLIVKRIIQDMAI